MTNKEIGNFGENAACRFLEELGYETVMRNYHTRFGEIDIISKKDGFFIFSEVKTRKNSLFGAPYEYVDKRKQEKIIITAENFMIPYEGYGVRFDVIEVYYGEKNGSLFVKKIEHYENAFTP